MLWSIRILWNKSMYTYLIHVFDVQNDRGTIHFRLRFLVFPDSNQRVHLVRRQKHDFTTYSLPSNTPTHLVLYIFVFLAPLPHILVFFIFILIFTINHHVVQVYTVFQMGSNVSFQMKHTL
uniref:Uncharacterized protein n=1 Tax=Cacopsylla melanoneura TaxID=428564 RepID=A0A8D8QXJ3_9HEMI